MNTNSTAKKGSSERNGIQEPPLSFAGVNALGVQEFHAKRRRVVQMVGVGMLMAVVWMLLLLPIIFYHLPVDINSVANNLSSSFGECSSAFPYPTAGGVCQTSLTGVLSSTINCEAEGTPLVLSDGEIRASELLNRLLILKPSVECRKAVTSFLCLSLFGLCDGSGVALRPTSEQCEGIRDRVCKVEWIAATEFDVDLPDCKDFPLEQVACPVQNGSGSGSKINVLGEELLPCSEDFFREEDSGPCVPSCHTWKEISAAEVISTDVAILLSAVIGFICGLAVITISFVRFRKMFVFPSIFIVYMTFDLLINEFFIIVTYIDRSLYCTSPNLFRSISEVAPFCVITGMLYMYTLLQMAIWWLFHMTALFWTIRFPLHARSFQTSHRIKIHVALVITGLLFPLLTILATTADFAVSVKSDALLQGMNITFVSGGLGYGQIGFPPFSCAGKNRDVVYYTSILPINIIVIVGITELILLFWTIHVQYGFFGDKQSKSSLFRMGTAERKILITLCYYVLMTMFALSRFTIYLRNAGPYQKLLFDYFSCEVRGHDPSESCDVYRDKFRPLNYPILTAIALVLIAMFPAVNLVYAVNI